MQADCEKRSEAPNDAAPTIKIGIVGSHGIPNRHGGFEQFVEQLVGHPSWMDHRFHFFVYGESEGGEFNQVTTVRCVNAKKSVSPLRYYAVSTNMAARECDVIMACGVGISIFGLKLQLMQKGVVTNPDGAEWRRSKWSRLARLVVHLMYYPSLLFADRIVIDAEALRTDFPRLFRKKMVYIGYQSPPQEAIDNPDQLLAELGISGRFNLVLARLEPENNIKMIIDGYRKAGIDEPLIIVGGTQTPFFTNVLKNENRGNVRFVGAIYDKKVLLALRTRCSIYLHGHSVGGTNPSLVEALSTLNGRLFCHDNKYNREVAGAKARYFKSPEDLAALFRNSDAECVVRTDDPRFSADLIAQSYRQLFTELYLLHHAEIGRARAPL